MRTESGQNLCLDELYARFESTDALFPIRYVAYHHFRQKGWVVRSGMTMGADYLLYKDGPPFTHASFIVSVQTDEDDPEPRTPRTFLDYSECSQASVFSEWSLGTLSQNILSAYSLDGA